MRYLLLALTLLCVACGTAPPSPLTPSPLVPLSTQTIAVTIHVLDATSPLSGAWVRHDQTGDIRTTDGQGAVQWSLPANIYASWSVRACRYWGGAAGGTFERDHVVSLSLSPDHRGTDCHGPVW